MSTYMPYPQQRTDKQLLILTGWIGQRHMATIYDMRLFKLDERMLPSRFGE